MATKRVKVAVTGAAGQIGYALLFRIASGQMFGLDTEVELQLLELESALPALHGVAMELDDCAFPLLKNVLCTSELSRAFQDATGPYWWGPFPANRGWSGQIYSVSTGGSLAPRERPSMIGRPVTCAVWWWEIL